MVKKENNSFFVSAVVFAFAILLVYGIGTFIPGGLNWGFHFLGFLGPVVSGGMFVFFLIFLFLIKNGVLDEKANTLAGWMHKNPVKFLILSMGIFTIGSYILKVQAPLLGDGFFLVKNFSEAYHNIQPLDFRNEPLATYYYYSIFKFVGASSYKAFLNSFWVADIIAMIGFMVVCFYLVKRYIENPVNRFIGFFLLLTASYVQLFFGYVETYSIMLFSIALYVFCVSLYFDKRVPFVFPALSFFFAATTHYLNGLLIFSLFYVGYLQWKERGKQEVITGGIVFLIGVFIFFAIFGFNLESLYSYVPHNHYLALTENSASYDAYSQPYSFFSLFHWIDVFNLYFLAMPAAMFLVVAGLFRQGVKAIQSSLVRFLVIAFIPVIAFTIAVKYDLGAARDWDVSISFFFLIILAGCLMFFQRAERSAQKAGMVILLISIFTSGSYIAMNSTVTPAIKRTEELLDSRTVSQLGHYTTALHLSMYFHQVHDDAPVADLWRNYMNKYPLDERGYLNTLQNLKLVKPDDYMGMDSIYMLWLKSGAGDSTAKKEYSKFNMELGNLMFQRQNFDNARSYYQKVILLQPELVNGYNNLGSVYASEGKYPVALKYFEQALSLDSTYSDALYNAGSAYFELGNRQLAAKYMNRAAELGNNAALETLEDSVWKSGIK